MKCISNIKLSGILVLNLAIAIAALPSKAAEISITGLDWDAGKVIGAILEKIIETQYREEVVVREGATADALKSMDAGDGKYDVFPDLWMPNQRAAWKNYIDDRKTITHNSQPYNTSQGFFVPAAISEKYNINSIEDLKNPEIIKLFDADRDGKAEYWAGEEKWGATTINQIKMHSYGLSDSWVPTITTNDTFKAALKVAMEEKTPILFYHWAPEWVFDAYSLKQISEPKYFAGCDVVYQPDERADWIEASKYPCAFEDGEVWVVFSRSLETRSPQVAKFLRAVRFDPDTINKWVAATGIEGKAAAEVADAWIASNPDTVKRWTVGAISDGG